MKKVYIVLSLFFVMAVGMASAQSTETKNTPAGADAAITMVKEKYDIGKIPSGEAHTFYMEFANQTKKPVVIKNVMAGCGCTVPEKPTEPIMPGKTGKIKVVYTPTGPGPVNKNVEIYVAGYNEPKVVYFTGESLAKK